MLESVDEEEEDLTPINSADDEDDEQDYDYDKEGGGGGVGDE